MLPERYDGDEQAMINRIIEHRKRGKDHHIIINAEGIGHSNSMAKRVEAATGIETRATVLGHLQRGGSPTLERLSSTSLVLVGLTSTDAPVQVSLLDTLEARLDALLLLLVVLGAPLSEEE